ncbi:hypothetical protein D3C76_1733310 [compost metagenome]
MTLACGRFARMACVACICLALQNIFTISQVMNSVRESVMARPQALKSQEGIFPDKVDQKAKKPAYPATMIRLVYAFALLINFSLS